MLRLYLLVGALLLSSSAVLAEDSEEGVESEAPASEENGDGIEKPKTLSGMSILGNEEAPKSLVILSDTLDDRARPVDKEVFLRELSFYEIRSGE